MTDFRALISLLVNNSIEFIIVGGAAATAHGSARLTEDLDIVYRRTPTTSHVWFRRSRRLNLTCAAPPVGLPFSWEDRTVWNGLTFTLTTTLGPLDLLGEITVAAVTKSCCPTLFSYTSTKLSVSASASNASST